ncbi:WRKY DNA-binding transcription factor 70-like [Vigna umbellata]|uniref:WRKY DNA-binding transcription factor 70-like n=1 Tax=Vigna umbellata TaxID=87088 RepID=UPI001F5E9CBD|nr:WRKY DNA-binding transcription factor 70-like [Vigna umbellata]
MDQRKVLEELLRGYESATKLRVVMNEKDESEIRTLQCLAKNVLRSFTNTLFLLNSHHHHLSHLLSPTKSQDSQESSKTFTSFNNRRGCYKRKRHPQEWEKISEAPPIDGHQWRKYGQKEILKAKYSRNYYRCTHKYDQNCQATKQVQRIQENPPLYKTTYLGHHTCNDLLSSEIILDSNDSLSDTSILISFNNSFPPTKQECPFLSSSSSSSSSSINPSPSLITEEIIPSCYDYMLPPEPTFDDYSMHNNVTPPLDHWDDMSSALCDSDIEEIKRLLMDSDD